MALVGLKPLLLCFGLFALLASAHDGVAVHGLRKGRASSKGIIVPPEDSVSSALHGPPTHLKMVSGKMKAHLDAWLSDILSDKFDEDPKKCAEETEEMMKELRYAYTRRLVPSVLRDECKHFLYYERFGGDEEVCLAIVEHLVNTWKGDEDYEAWCRDVYSKRHTAKDASEIPKKEDPGPRKGDYADVEEFSYPNDADPEKPCHGSPDCKKESKKGGEPSALAKDDSPKKRGRSEAEQSGTPPRALPIVVLPLLLIGMHVAY